MKKFFNKGLYFEGLRQTKLASLIIIAIMCLWAVFFPLSKLSLGPEEFVIVSNISGSNFNPLLLFCYGILIPALGLSLFSFLNKRNSSDFYHSLPHKRVTIYCSLMLSVVTWLAIAIVLPSTIELVICMFGSRSIEMELSSILPFVLNVFCSGLFILGAGLVAMSLTGTLFSNIVTTLLIIFLPRIVFSGALESVRVLSLVLPDNYFSVTPSSIIPFESFFSLFTSQDGKSLVVNALYCLVIAIIYLTIGGILFNKRKSESAGFAAINNKVQTIIRVALSFIVSMFACMSLLSGEDLLLIIIFFLLAIILFFAYEYLSTKKLSNIKKSMPGLGILLLLTLIFLGGVTMAKNSILSVDWNVEETSSVKVSTNNLYSGDASYESLMAAKLELHDEKIIEMLVNELKENQENAKKGTETFHNIYYNYGGFHFLPVEITTKQGKTHKRELNISDENYGKLYDMLIGNTEYLSALTTPDSSPSNVFVSCDSYNFNSEESRKIYDMYVEELKGIDPEIILAVKQNTPFVYATESSVEKLITETNESPVYMSVSGRQDYQNYYNYYALGSLTPNTLKYTLSLLNQENADDKLASYWQDFQKNGKLAADSEIMEIIIRILPANDNIDLIYHIYADDNTSTIGSIPQKLVDEISSQITQIGQEEIEKNYCLLTFAQRFDEKYIGDITVVALPISEKLYEELCNSVQIAQ